MSWAVYNHANYGIDEFETWWREAYLHSVALKHIVSHPDVLERPFLLSVGDADEVPRVMCCGGCTMGRGVTLDALDY
jgi:hypothetical protein